MSRGPCTFRQRAVTKAVKAVAAAGVQVGQVEIDKDGKIVVVAAQGLVKSPTGALDQWMIKHADQAKGD
jgi:hypothetical protein